jgi:ribonuclease HI
MNKKLIIFTDGGARGNPGPSGCGAVLKNEENETIAEISRYIGQATNNQAEYQAVIFALEKAADLKAEELVFYLDSELLVKQINGQYKVKNQELQKLFIKVFNKKAVFKKTSFFHISREKNKEADKLANLAMDNKNL